MNNLLDPKQDFIFKKIFGNKENERLLLSLLNSILKGRPHIKSLTFENAEIPKILNDNKTMRLDVRATTDDDTMIDIEIQCKNTGEIPARAVHYTANILPNVIKTNESYNKYRVIGIWILGENVTKRQNAISEAYMTFQKNHPDDAEIMTDTMRVFFIELQKFKPQKENMHDILTAWLEFLKEPALIDKKYLEVDEVKSAMDELKHISSDEESRAIYALRQRTLNDLNSEKTVAVEKALAEGEQIGLEKGEYKGRIETARNLLDIGLSLEQISKATALSIEEIKNLKHSEDNRLV